VPSGAQGAHRQRAIVEQLNKQLSDDLCLNVRCKEYFNGKFCAKAATYAHPGLQRIEPVFSKQHVALATSAAGSALARLLRPHLAPATWADDALDLFASVWRYELAAAVALLGALRRILINYV
jgi:hypothetical protein